MNKSLVVAVLALALAVVALFFPQVTERVVETTNLQGVRNEGARGNFVQGLITSQLSYGQRYATTTAAGSTFSAQELCNNGLIVLTPAASGAKTVNVASSTAMFGACIPQPGDSRTVLVYHATTTGTNAITFADTGVNTNHTEEEGATTVLDISEQAYLTFTNVNGSEMLFDVSIRQVAD